MLGLETWLENVLLAQESIDKAQPKEVFNYLQTAFESLETTRTDKWMHWYRGDKKMNMAATRRSTEAVLELLR